MLPTHATDYLNQANPHIKPTLWSQMFDFMGRIAVSFGIYQTVVAFRKFKNPVG